MAFGPIEGMPLFSWRLHLRCFISTDSLHKLLKSNQNCESRFREIRNFLSEGSLCKCVTLALNYGATNVARVQKTNPTSGWRGDPISKHANRLRTNKHLVMGPGGTRNQERLRWRDQQQFTGHGLGLSFWNWTIFVHWLLTNDCWRFKYLVPTKFSTEFWR